MNTYDLQEILENGESETLAVFEKQNDNALLRTACAMANTQGGRIVVGAKERLKPITPQERFSFKGVRTYIGYLNFYNEIAWKLNPKVQVEVEQVDLDGSNKLVLVTVDSYGGDGYVSLDGVAWRRVGIVNKKIQEKDSSSADVSSIAELVRSNDKLDLPIKKFFSAKVSELLSLGGYRTVRDVVSQSDTELLRSSVNFRKNTLGEVKRTLEAHGLSLGMQVAESSKIPDANFEGASSVALEPEDDLRSESSSAESLELSERATVEIVKDLVGTSRDIRNSISKDEERLRVDRYAGALARFFASTDSERLCFGVFGEWGRGKTYLMGKVADNLKREAEYAVVKFSAWKYRRPPQLWAHLYECVVASSKQSMPFGNWILGVPVRSALARHGLWPFVASLAFLNLSFFIKGNWFGILGWCAGIFGIAGFAYFALVSLRFLGSLPQFSKLLRFSSHKEHLGLQATVASDLEAVLVGWMPNENWFKKPESVADENAQKGKTDWKASLTHDGNRGKLAAYGAMVLLLCIQLAVATAAPLIYESAILARGIVVFLCLVVFGALPAIALLLPQKNTKALLIVDDLDRVPPSEMLAIIESLMLMLDDDRVEERLQIAMLVEEDVVGAAIVEKYAHLREFRAQTDVTDEKKIATSPQELKSLVESNMQKLFLAHVRLGKISKIDRETIVKAYCKKLSVAEDPSLTKPAASGKSSSSNSTNVDDTATKKQSSSEASTATEPRQYEIATTLTSSEVAAIEKAIAALDSFGNEDSRVSKLGPRSIRSFINKYQLARFLLSELYPKVIFSSNELADTLACCIDGPSSKAAIEYPPAGEPLTDDFKIRLICDQVT